MTYEGKVPEIVFSLKWNWGSATVQYSTVQYSSGSGCIEEVVGQPPRLDHLRCLSDDDDQDKDDDNVLRSWDICKKLSFITKKRTRSRKYVRRLLTSYNKGNMID